MQTSQKLSLTSMGCGTWAWGNRLLWGYDARMDDQLQAVFELCVSNGVTLFDPGDSEGTERLNGRSELLDGRFSREYVGSGKENICIATKLQNVPSLLLRQVVQVIFITINFRYWLCSINLRASSTKLLFCRIGGENY